MTPMLILDAYCGAGGAAVGYWRALNGNCTIVGVDIEPQSRYPFYFVRGDAIAFIRNFGYLFDFIHASPPCQVHSIITPDRTKHTDHIAPTREALQAIDTPHVIENVTGAKDHLRNPVMLWGAQFNLKVYRHRLFECSLPVDAPAHYFHHDNAAAAGHKRVEYDGKSEVFAVAPNGKRKSGTRSITRKEFVSVTGGFSGIDYCKWAMGIDWMIGKELSQAIPPAMTHYIGSQMFRGIGYETIMPEMNVPVQLNFFEGVIA